MELDLSKTILVTHKACQDGSACAILFLAAGGKKENIHFSNPSHKETDELVSDLLQYNTQGSDIMLVDISISKDMAEYIDKSLYVNDITILDHHASAIPLGDYCFCHVDDFNLNCGCKMFYDWILEHIQDLTKVSKYKELVTLTNDVDLWQHNYPESRQLADFHKILGQELFIERFLKNSDPDLCCQELYLISTYNKKREIDTANIKKNVKKFGKIIDGVEYNFGIVLARGADQSLLGHAIVDDPDMNLDIAIMVEGNSISFRCRDDCSLDLSVLAKLNLGGGHQRASGCSVSTVIGIDLLHLIMDKLKFEK